MLGPWVILQFRPDFGFIPSIEDQHRAAFIDEGTRPSKCRVIDELIDKLRVLVPKRLFACAFRGIAIWAGGPNGYKEVFHDTLSPNAATSLSFWDRPQCAARLFLACGASQPVVEQQSLR